jgi:predicted metal-dependent TIM-barrel fold hydrolase
MEKAAPGNLKSYKIIIDHLKIKAISYLLDRFYY